MKRILMAFSFLLAIGAALITQATANPLATRYFKANTDDIAGTCVTVSCDENTGSTCTVPANFATYKSTGSQADCNTAVTLFKHP